MGMDHYVKLKELGGVSGAILAQDRHDPNRKVVIKRVSDGAQGMEELGASLRVRHPNIVKFVESFMSDGSLYVAVKYEPGGDLDSLLSRLLRLRKFPTTLTQLSWFVQMLDALAYCHESNIIHRDVKPSNIFLSEDTKTLYLGDFGSAKTLGAGNVTTTFVGSPMWISPEVLLGTPYTYSSDVWSMGCVFYEMASLRRPFAAPNFARLVQQITSGRVSPLPDLVEPPVRAIIMSMLVLDPDKRPSAAELLMKAQRALFEERHRSELAKQRQQPAPVSPPPAANPASGGGDDDDESAGFVRPEQYQRSQQVNSGEPPVVTNGSNSASVGAEQLAGSMYANAGTAVAAAMEGSPYQRPLDQPLPQHLQPHQAQQAPPQQPPPPAAQPSAPADEVTSAASDNSAASVGEHDDDGDVGAAAADEEASGKPVAMFVAITPRNRKKKKPAGQPKKKRPAAAAPAAAAAPSTPPATPPPNKGSGEVRTFPPKQLGAKSPPPAAAVNVRPQSPSPAAAGNNGRVRSATLTENIAGSASSGRRGSSRESGSSRRLNSLGSKPVAAAQPPPPPMPKRALAAALEHNAIPAREQQQPPPSQLTPAVVKQRPAPQGAQPLVGGGAGKARVQPGVLRQRLAAAAARNRKVSANSDSGSDDEGTSNGAPAPDEMRKSQWVRARNNDVSDIENYLRQFRGHDEELLHSYDAQAGGSGSRRRPSLVAQTGAAARGEPSAGGRGARRPSPEAIPPPPAQQLQRGVVKSDARSGGNPNRKPAGGKKGAARNNYVSPERRLNASASNLNSENNSFGHRGAARQACYAHQSQPRTVEEQERMEEERRAARAKREAERERMAQMIREQRERRQNQQKKKKADPFDVQIVLPGKT